MALGQSVDNDPVAITTVSVANVAALKAASRASLGDDFVRVLDYGTAGAGGGKLVRFVASSQPAENDDLGRVLVAANGDQWEDVHHTTYDEIDVRDFGVLPDSQDSSTNLRRIIEGYPDNPLRFPMGTPNGRYIVTIDVNNDPDRATMESNLGNRNATQKSNYEYCPKWRGTAGTGDPEGGSSIIAPNDATGAGYAIKMSRRIADPQIMDFPSFRELAFWGDTGNKVNGVVFLDDSGHLGEFINCKWRFCEYGLRMKGTWGVTCQRCSFGGRGFQSVDVGVWQEASPDFNSSYCGWNVYDRCGFSTDKCGIISDNTINSNPAIGDIFYYCDFENNDRLAFYYKHCGYRWIPVRLIGDYEEAINNLSSGSVDLSTYGLGSVTLNQDDAFLIEGRGNWDIDNLNSRLVARRDKTATGITGTNMVIDGSDSAKVTPDGHTVASDDIGKSVEITAGTGFNVISTQVVSVDVGGGTWTLADSAGTTSSTGGTWRAMRDLEGPTVRLRTSSFNGEHDFDDDSELIVEDVFTTGTHGGVTNLEAKRTYTFDETIDQHSAARADRHFTERETGVVNYYPSIWDIDNIEIVGNATKSMLCGTTPTGGCAAEVLLPAGVTEEFKFSGNAGSDNYRTGVTAPTGYNGFTFAIRLPGATGTATKSVALKNSSRSGNFSPDITLSDDRWQSYQVVTNRGERAHHYKILQTLAVAESGTGMTIDATDSTKVTPDGYTPVASDVNKVVRITAGTGFTVDNYKITAIDGGQWVLHQSAGTTSSTGGSWEGFGTVVQVGDIQAVHFKSRMGLRSFLDRGSFATCAEGGGQLVPPMSRTEWINTLNSLWTAEVYGDGDFQAVPICNQLRNNGNFSAWTGSVPDNWSVGTNITVSEETADTLGGTSAVRLEGGANGNNFGSSNNVLRLDLSAAEIVAAGQPYIVMGIVKRVSGSGSLYYSTGYLNPALTLLAAADATDDWQFFWTTYPTSETPHTEGELWLGADSGDVWLIDRVAMFSGKKWLG